MHVPNREEIIAKCHAERSSGLPTSPPRRPKTPRRIPTAPLQHIAFQDFSLTAGAPASNIYTAMQNPHIETEPPSSYGDVTGVILAGGKSSRMGRDKARLELGGVSLFDKMAATLRSVVPRVIIAGDRPDLAGPDLSYFPDRYPGSALGGLYTGLAEAGTSFVFVSPCDLPFPKADVIRTLLDQRSGYDVVVPRTRGGLEPVFAVYGRNCLGPMQEMLERNHYRIYDFYPRMRTLELDMSDFPADWERSLWNVNTLDDYLRIRRTR